MTCFVQSWCSGSSNIVYSKRLILYLYDPIMGRRTIIVYLCKVIVQIFKISPSLIPPQMVTAVAKHLDVDPTYLQFFKAQTYRDAPGQALRCTFDGTLKDLLVFCRPKVPKRMFYQQLTIPIHELENKKQMKCIYLSPEQVRVFSHLCIFRNFTRNRGS